MLLSQIPFRSCLGDYIAHWNSAISKAALSSIHAHTLEALWHVLIYYVRRWWLTLLILSPSSLETARDCAANASFSSNKSTSPTLQPALLSYMGKQLFYNSCPWHVNLAQYTLRKWMKSIVTWNTSNMGLQCTFKCESTWTIYIGPRHTLTAPLTAGTGPIPITEGSTPAWAHDTTFAIGLLAPPSTHPWLPRITTAAPSLMPEALPAVTVPVPSLMNAGRSLARVLGVVPARGNSSLSTVVEPINSVQNVHDGSDVCLYHLYLFLFQLSLE